MAFDPNSGGLILFGGFNSSTQILNDTWMWSEKSWARLSPQSNPIGRYGFSLAYHSGLGKLILFGGKARLMGGSEPEGTWAWDGTNWLQLSVGGSPPWRMGGSMAEVNSGVLLFGGTAPAPVSSGWSYFGDTWFLGQTWSELTQTPSPSPRVGASMVHYPPGNSVLLFGGGSGAVGGSYEDTWLWELSKDLGPTLGG